MYRNRLVQWSFLVVIIAIVVGLVYHIQGSQYITTANAATRALPGGDLSVVGKPSLPAATVNAILKSLSSTMSGTGQVVEQASQQTNIDDAFALAVWWTETNDGAAGVGLADRNPGSVRGSVGYPSAFDGYTIYPTYSAAIVYWFNMLKNIYVNRGLNTVYLISHPYVGTSSSPLWAGKVVALMQKYRGEAPSAPIVVLHGKRVTEPSVYRSITPVPVSREQQAQSQIDKSPEIPSSIIVQHVNTTPKTPVETYVIVFFALLLALSIIACVLWFEKRSDYNRVQVLAPGENVQVGTERDEQRSGTPHLQSPRSVRSLRRISLSALQDTDALISTTQELDTVKTDALVMPAEMDRGENFRIPHKLYLPSTSKIDPPNSVGPLAAGNQRVRSTGLLSRYGETQQK